MKMPIKKVFLTAHTLIFFVITLKPLCCYDCWFDSSTAAAQIATMHFGVAYILACVALRHPK